MDNPPKKLVIISSISIAIILALVGIFLFRVSNFFEEKKPSVKTENFKIYFSGEDTDILEKEEVPPLKGTIEEKIRYCMINLINGPKIPKHYPAIPEGVKIVSVRLVNEFTAEVTFSPEISKNHIGGSQAEIQTIYSVVNTIMINFDEIKRVVIRVDGSNEKTLAGHIDITQPFGLRRDIIKGE